jgi:hypothetical protein
VRTAPALHILSYRSTENHSALTGIGTASPNSCHSLKSQFNQHPSIIVTTWTYHLVLKYWKQTIWFEWKVF